MNILITGTSSGLGKALYQVFEQNGNNLLGMSKSESDCTDFVCDLSDFRLIREYIGKIKFNMPTIDYLILNAGVLGGISKAINTDLNHLKSVLDINVFSNKVLLDSLMLEGVTIKNVIFISSGASLKAYDGWLSYCISKATLNQMCKCYALENENIHFLSLAPGVIKTKMQDEIISSNEQEFGSISKFKSLYDTNPTALDIANKIYSNLDILLEVRSGEYFDLREVK